MKKREIVELTLKYSIIIEEIDNQYIVYYRWISQYDNDFSMIKGKSLEELTKEITQEIESDIRSQMCRSKEKIQLYSSY